MSPEAERIVPPAGRRHLDVAGGRVHVRAAADRPELDVAARRADLHIVLDILGQDVARRRCSTSSAPSLPVERKSAEATLTIHVRAVRGA